MGPAEVEALFTRGDGSYLFARWGRPIVPVVFGVAEESLMAAVWPGVWPAMAALDVLTTEPPESNRLLSLDNVICTGHNAFYSPESLEAQWRRPTEEVTRVLRGEWPTALVNPEAKKRFVERWGEMRPTQATLA